MAQVTVTIAGRVYRMACGEGEERHLQELAYLVDTRLEFLKQSFGEIGDQRLTVMAAITFADELAEAKRRIAELEADLVNMRANSSDAETDQQEWADRLADSLGEAAMRIERVAQGLNGAGRG
jgi:cell division protein ZapA